MGKIFPVLIFVFWIPLGVAATLGWHVGKRAEAPSKRTVVLMGLGFMAVDLFVALPLGLAVFFNGNGDMGFSASELVGMTGEAIRVFWILLLATFPIFFFVAAGYGFRAAKKREQSER